jgi:hypothetical protein
LAFTVGKFDMTLAYSVTEPLLKDVSKQMPRAICELAPIGVNRSLIANQDKPPFDNPDLWRAIGEREVMTVLHSQKLIAERVAAFVAETKDFDWQHRIELFMTELGTIGDTVAYARAVVDGAKAAKAASEPLALTS